MATKPNPRTWTLRLKHHTTTILLHVDPLQSLSSLKAELLKAVQQTNPSGTFNEHDIPQNSDEIMLARPKDINDLSQGWERLEMSEKGVSGAEDVVGTGKGKGKASTVTKGSAKASSGLKDCPQGAGLRDGGVVAFKFKSKDDEADWEKVEKDEDEAIEVAEEDRQEVAEEWDVVVPTMEETYGDGNQAAVVGEGGEGDGDGV